MRRVRASVAVMAITAMAAGIMLMGAAAGEERPLPVQVVRVALGDVEQLTVLTGVVGYRDAYAALAPAAGVVAQVYVEPGDAVAAGQVLFRMDNTQEVAALSAAWAAGEKLVAYPEAAQAAAQAGLRLDVLTVRAPAEGVVQQVLVTRHGGVTLGMPAVLLSGPGQEILCPAVVKDASAVQPGMRARILFGGATVCMGTVDEVGPAQAEAATGQVLHQVRILPDEPLSLPSGAAVEAEIIRASAEGVPVLPVTALTEEGAVWWICDGRVWETPVTVHLQDEVHAWISLPEGTAAVNMPEGLRQGQPVLEVAQ